MDCKGLACFKSAPFYFVVLGFGYCGIMGADAPSSPAPILKRDESPLAGANPDIRTYAQVVEQCLPSVVTILTAAYPETEIAREDESSLDFDTRVQAPDEPRRGGGSGVVVSQDGYVITNFHVIDNADEVQVRIPGASSDLEAKVVGVDIATDLAVLKVEAKALIPITIADSSKLRAGDAVLALGSPYGLEQTVSLGIVSATGRSLSLGNHGFEDIVQTDAPIHPGNSGGALVDAAGRLVGINTAAYLGWGAPSGIGFAVPSNLAIRVTEDLVKHGHVIRGFLGVHLEDVSEKDALPYTGRRDWRPARVSAIEEG